MLKTCAAFFWAALAVAQTTPKDTVAEYPAHGEINGVSIGAEYTVHTFSNGKQGFVTTDYLVVEVAIFPARGREVEIQNGNFGLRVNGQKQPLLPQPPGFVAAALKYPNWTQKPTLTAAAGMGDAGVTIGRQPRVERFPGDPTPQQTRLPRGPRAPEPDNPNAESSAPPVRAEDVVVATALPDVNANRPVSGYLYFPYSGKIRKIRSLELLYSGAAGELTLKLL